MKSFLRAMFLCFFPIVLSACIQIDTRVYVKTDGSGTIEERFLMRKDLLQQMKQMMEEVTAGLREAVNEDGKDGTIQTDADSPTKAKTLDLFDEAKQKERAGQKGEGVTFIGGSTIMTDGFEGYKAVFAFEDINKVKINQNPGEKVPSFPQIGAADSDKTGKEYLTFTFKRGTPAELIIKSPRRKIKTQADSSDSSIPSQKIDGSSIEMTSQVKHLFQGMNIGLTVAVEGTIVETNAAFREGSTITIAELNFGKVMEKPETLALLSLASQKSMEESIILMQQIPGVNVDLQEEIRIRFENRESDTPSR